MRNNPRDVVSVTESSIRTTDGKMHWIDPKAMQAAMDRAQKYLEEAVRWGKERASHLKSGNKKQDTRRHDQFLQRHSISKEVWFPINNEFDETDVMDVMAALHHWIEGTMDEFEADYSLVGRGTRPGRYLHPVRNSDLPAVRGIPAGTSSHRGGLRQPGDVGGRRAELIREARSAGQLLTAG